LKFPIGTATLALCPDEVCRILGLSQSELADLFHVRQPSLAQWRVAGVPANRRASVERLVELARILERELITSRIPEIVRTPDDWLEGRSILQTIRERGIDSVYGYLGRLFAYQG
jgi:DNA-binding transcriptional regulator YdaS (Cro superfamily)